MKLYIPEIGDEFTLEKDWTFTLYTEYRNASLLPIYTPIKFVISHIDILWHFYLATVAIPSSSHAYNFGKYREWLDSPLSTPYKSTKVTLLKGTILKVDRIYIRKRREDFSSLTFYIKESPNVELKGKKRLRFWAKLSDVNNIEIKE